MSENVWMNRSRGGMLLLVWVAVLAMLVGVLPAAAAPASRPAAAPAEQAPTGQLPVEASDAQRAPAMPTFEDDIRLMTAVLDGDPLAATLLDERLAVASTGDADSDARAQRLREAGIEQGLIDDPQTADEPISEAMIAREDEPRVARAGRAGEGSISGTVTDTAGDPVEDVFVTVRDVDGAFVAGDFTDAAGDYAVTNVGGGSYGVLYSPRSNHVGTSHDGILPLVRASLVDVAVGATVNIDVELEIGFRIKGTVRGPAGPLESQTVFVSDVGTRYPERVTGFLSDATAADGTYLIEGLDPDLSYEVVVSTAEFGFASGLVSGVVAAYRTTAGKTLTANINLAEGGTIKGVVTNAATDAPLSGQSVTAGGRSTVTDDDGAYRLSGLPADTSLLVRFGGSGGFLSEYFDDTRSFTDATRVVLAAGQTRTINAGLTRGATLAGTLKNDAGAGVVGRTLVLADDFSVFTSVFTEGDGSWLLAGVAPDVDLVLRGSADGQQSTYYGNTPYEHRADVVRAEIGETVSGLDITLPDGGILAGTIDFRVADEGFGSVLATPLDAPGVASSAGVGPDGKFRVDTLAPGRYVVSYTASGVDGRWVGGTNSATATPLDVTAGDTTAADFAGSIDNRRGSVSGTVVDASTDAPLGGIDLDLRRRDGAFVASGRTGADGVFTMDGVLPGRYAVELDDRVGRYLAEVHQDQDELTAATFVTVGPNQDVTGLDLDMTPDGEIAGTVGGGVFESGAIIPSQRGICVATVDLSANIGSATVAPDGRFWVRGLSPTPHRVVAYDCGSGDYVPAFAGDSNSSNIRDAGLFDVRSGATTTKVNPVARKGGRIEGTVTSSRVGFLGVELDTPLVPSFFMAADVARNQVDSLDFSIGGLVDTPTVVRGFADFVDGYAVGAASLANATTYTPTADETLTGADLDLTVPEFAAVERGTGVITGTATSPDGGPLHCGSAGAFDLAQGSFGGAAVLEDGTFEITGLRAGSFLLYVSDCRNVGTEGVLTYHPDSRTSEGSTPVVVAEGKTTTAAVTVQSGARLVVEVKDADGMVIPGCITVYSEGLGTTGSGTDVLTGLRPGMVRVRARDCEGDESLSPVWSGGALRRDDAALVELKAGRTTSLELALPRASALTIKTDLPEGTARVDVCVFGYDVDGNLVASERLGTDGRAVLRGLASVPHAALVRDCYQQNARFPGVWTGDADSQATALFVGLDDGRRADKTATVNVASSAVRRLAGDTRVKTAAAISASSYPDGGASAVVLSRSDNFADALAGTPLADSRRAPILLTAPGALDADTAAEITRVLDPGEFVYLLGGPVALSEAVEKAVQDLGHPTIRIAGETRFDTAIAIAQATTSRPTSVLITTGNNFPDALSAGAAASAVGGVVVLTPSEARHPAVDAYLKTVGDADILAIGGPAGRPYEDVAEPLIGETREDTAVLVARRFFIDVDTVGVSRQDSFPDAMTGGARMARVNGPVLLTKTNELHPSVAEYLCDNRDITDLAYVFGGEVAMSQAVVGLIDERIKGTGC